MRFKGKQTVAGFLIFLTMFLAIFFPTDGTVQAASPSAYVTSYTLKIRNAPSTHFKTLRMIAMADRVTVLGRRGKYAHVRYGNTFGYVQMSHLSWRPFRSYTAYVSSYTLKVRSQANVHSISRGMLRMSDRLTVLGRGNKYALIRSGHVWGFVQKSYLATAPFRTYVATVTADSTNLFREVGKPASAFQKLTKGDQVTVLGKGATYALVQKDGATGFVTFKSLQAIQPVSYDQKKVTQQYGIDISHYQGSVNFNAVKQAGNSFIIAKATDGASYVDPTFEKNAVAASRAGLVVNAYHFFRAKTTSGAVKEADHFASVIKKVASERRVSVNYLFLDVETTNGLSKSSVKAALTGNVLTFLGRMRKDGLNHLGIYSNLSFFQTSLDLNRIKQTQPAQPKFLIWLARYRNEALGPGFSADIWQYTSAGKVNGVVGAVDKNISYYNTNGM
ncbi:GH25 family lysozyme [Sporolactobacillus spathodeae]|uniref:GH25 family lysozyme M1 (1,4-beta-N-acetylmuramidase) n=1 Tax=Sporolactobacillus spathodeae TaxID=1465502 RepID=A0ABS2Q8K8_9BACL|nr:GH25 family lysozyme M1 (1,4-beta-N-acetylmuramidase) [Sporolactobacillus spathodeae]